MSEQMTPREAQDELDATRFWNLTVSKDNYGDSVIPGAISAEEVQQYLDAGARALDSIAGDTLQYGVEYRYLMDREWLPPKLWTDRRDAAELLLLRHRCEYEFARLVCRRVSEHWEVTDD